jgi:peptidyl-prolyl cis-trans isomerase SDCCAG10
LFFLHIHRGTFLKIVSSRLTHKLQFEAHAPALAKDASTKTDDWFEIYDPRNPINKRRREASKDIMKTRQK